MSARLGEENKINCEVVSITSAASALSDAYSFDDCERITFIVGAGTVAGAATAITPTLQVRQSGDIGLSTSTTIGGATARLGPTTANQFSGIKTALITITTAATGAETIILNGHTLTLNAGTNSTVTTALTFGSTLGATAAEGLETRMNGLSSVINNSTLSRWFTATTVSTAAVRITTNDTAATSLNAVTTGTIFTLTAERLQSIIEVKAEDLNSTSKYVGIGITTAATAVTYGVTVIKSGLRTMPPVHPAQVHKKST